MGDCPGKPRPGLNTYSRLMTEPPSFRRVVDDGGPRRRFVEVAVAALVIALTGIAIAKPWSTPVASPPTAVTQPVAASPTWLAGMSTPPAAAASDRPVGPGGTPAPSAPLPAAFTLPVPLPAADAWTGIRWRRLAPDDPLTAVKSMLRWRGGFVAVGSDASGATPVWTSTGGRDWEPLPVNTSTTFWPGLRLLGVFELPPGLVAITEYVDSSDCPGILGCLAFMSWTSPDGRAWTPLSVFNRRQPNTTVTSQLVAVGPAGLVVVSTGAPSRVVTSKDGVAWTDMPDGTLPSGYVINDLRGTATGYVVAGFRVANDGHWDAATLWSIDGRTWTPTDVLPRPADTGTTPAPSGTPSTLVESMVPGRGGMIAIGRELAPPGAGLWWQSSDARAWHPMPRFLPLGSVTCTAAGCGGQANGLLAGDGQRMLAVRGGTDARVWTSVDGVTWKSLAITGDPPTDQASRVVVLPGGLLLFGGSTTWFGEAIAR
jgi:hypothetical protein